MNKKLFVAGVLCVGLGSCVSATVLQNDMMNSLKMFMKEDTVSYLVSSLDNTKIVLGELEKLEGKIEALPEDLLDAIRLAEQSELVRRTLGEELFSYFIRNKKAEWDEYKAQVSQYELAKYLPIL